MDAIRRHHPSHVPHGRRPASARLDAGGGYTWKVYATDLAGNKQFRPGSQVLTVR